MSAKGASIATTVILAITLLLAIISVSTTYWGQVKGTSYDNGYIANTKIHIGLFRGCSSTTEVDESSEDVESSSECFDVQLDNVSKKDALRSARATAIMAILFLVGAVAFSAGLICVRKTIFIIVSGVLLALAVLMAIIALASFGVWFNELGDGSDYDATRSYGYSFGLFITAIVGCVCGIICLIIVFSCARREPENGYKPLDGPQAQFGYNAQAGYGPPQQQQYGSFPQGGQYPPQQYNQYPPQQHQGQYPPQQGYQPQYPPQQHQGQYPPQQGYQPPQQGYQPPQQFTQQPQYPQQFTQQPQYPQQFIQQPQYPQQFTQQPQTQDVTADESEEA